MYITNHIYHSVPPGFFKPLIVFFWGHPSTSGSFLVRLCINASISLSEKQLQCFHHQEPSAACVHQAYAYIFLFSSLTHAKIFLIRPTSAGSHSTVSSSSSSSHFASSCSLRTISSDRSSHMKQCMVRWNFG